jgi:pyruvate/2-oxoglutarate dehydrogenase complex dihydrolipoamide dehydrogenase (E3) component
MTERIKVDLCVIGAGSAGLSAAAGAVQMGASVALVEGGRMGGDCLNYGCVPSKALLAAAKRAQAMRDAGPFGIAPVEPEIDFAAVKDHIARTIAAIEPHDSVERFEGLGVRVIRAYGRFVSPTELEAGGARIVARRFVIATGSRPRIPPVPGLDAVPFLTNETIFDLRDRPGRLIVLGAGPIGLEMAQAHRRLGCEVVVIEAGRALAKDDPELAAVVLERLRAEGVEIHEGAPADRVSGGPGAIVVEAGGRRHAGTHLLVAVGRAPNVERLGLDAAGVTLGERGVAVDAGLRTSNRRIYAIGDVTGGLMFTHVAGDQASTILRSALFGLPAKARRTAIPWVTYVDPELAQVGLTEAQARAAHGDRLEILRAPFADNDRARAEGATTGLVKVMVARGEPVGVGIVGAQAGELIGLWALALARGAKISAMAGYVAPYPTLGEASKRAAGQYYAPRLFANPWVARAVRFVQRFP